MPQGYLITSMLFGNCKQSFPAIPRTKETGRLTCIGSRIEGCLILYKRYSIRFTMRFQICRITLIRDIFHHHMNCDNRKARFIDTYTLTQQFDKRQRIFPSRQSDKDFVSFFYQSILHHSFTEPPFNAANGFLFFRKLCHIFKNRLQKEAKRMI